MGLKKINEVFGYGLFVVGILKILLVILVIIQVGTNIIAVFNGGNVNADYYPVFSLIIALFQIVLAIGSIIMIILNTKKQPEVILGYLLGLGALLIELITPSIISFYIVFLVCSMYMKAGTKIRDKNIGSDRSYRKIKLDKKNTEWFYSEKKEHYEENKETQIEEKVYNGENKFIKENLTTVLLMVFMAIILLIFIILIVKTKNNHDNKNVNITKVERIQVDNNSQAESKGDINERKENINIQSNNLTLSQIANYFNNSNFSQKMRLQGYTMDATVLNNKITICSVGEGLTFNIEFVLNDNILYTEVLYNKSNPEVTLTEVLIASSFVDCIGQMKGYAEGTLLKTLVGENCTKYTIEKEGVEIKNMISSYDISIKVDLNSNLSFLNTY